MARELKFVGKKNATGGIASTILGLLAMILLGVAIYLSFLEKGNGGKIVGAIGVLVIVISLFGTILGIKGFKEKEKYYLYSVIGTLLCGILFVTMVSIIATTFI